MYIPVSHTNGGSIRNMIGMVMYRLVGMGLMKAVHILNTSPHLAHKFRSYPLTHPALCELPSVISQIISLSERSDPGQACIQGATAHAQLAILRPTCGGRIGLAFDRR